MFKAVDSGEYYEVTNQNTGQVVNVPKMQRQAFATRRSLRLIDSRSLSFQNRLRNGVVMLQSIGLTASGHTTVGPTGQNASAASLANKTLERYKSKHNKFKKNSKKAIKDLESKCEKLEKSKATLAKNNKQLQANSDGMKKIITDLEGMLRALKRSKKEDEDTIVTQKKELKAEKNRNLAIQESLDGLMAKDVKYKERKKRIKVLKKENRVLRERIQRMTIKAKQLGESFALDLNQAI